VRAATPVPGAAGVGVGVALCEPLNVVVTGSGWSSRCWYFGDPLTAVGALFESTAKVGVAFASYWKIWSIISTTRRDCCTPTVVRREPVTTVGAVGIVDPHSLGAWTGMWAESGG